MLPQCRYIPVLLATWLSGTNLAAQATVSSVTPAGSGRGPLEHAVYVSDEVQNDVFELYGAPLDGSAPRVRLNLPLPTGGDVVFSAFSDAQFAQVRGNRSLYVADQFTDEVFELFSVPNDGSAPALKLNGSLVTGGDVLGIWPTKQRVIYRADETVNDREELYSVPLDGSAARIPLTPGLDVWRVAEPSRDGSLVVFSTNEFGKEHLYVVPSDGGQPPLNLADSREPISKIAYTFFDSIEIVPGNVHVVYVDAEDDDSFLLGDLFSVRLDGSTQPVQLNQGPKFFVSPSPFSSFLRIAPNGERVLFVANYCQGFGCDPDPLQSVRFDGTGLVNLVPDGGIVGSYHISADSAYALFSSHTNGFSSASVYLALLDGSQTLQVLGPTTKAISAVEFAPGDASAVFVAVDDSSRSRLYALPSPNQPVLLSGNPPPSQGVITSGVFGFDPIEFTPDGKRVVFRGDLDQNDVLELYSVPLDASQPPQRLNPQLSGGQDIQSFRTSSNGSRVIYLADQSADEVAELFSAPTDGSPAPVQLNQTPVTGGDAIAYEPAKHSGRRAYRP